VRFDVSAKWTRVAHDVKEVQLSFSVDQYQKIGKNGDRVSQ